MCLPGPTPPSEVPALVCDVISIDSSSPKVWLPMRYSCLLEQRLGGCDLLGRGASEISESRWRRLRGDDRWPCGARGARRKRALVGGRSLVGRGRRGVRLTGDGVTDRLVRGGLVLLHPRVAGVADRAFVVVHSFEGR